MRDCPLEICHRKGQQVTVMRFNIIFVYSSGLDIEVGYL